MGNSKSLCGVLDYFPQLRLPKRRIAAGSGRNCADWAPQSGPEATLESARPMTGNRNTAGKWRALLVPADESIGAADRLRVPSSAPC